MKVHAEWRVGTDLFDIWIFQREEVGGESLQLVIAGEDNWEWRKVESNEKPKPTLTLPGDVYTALSAKLNGVLPPSEATERHLLDALKVRDRLLDAYLPEGREQ